MPIILLSIFLIAINEKREVLTCTSLFMGLKIINELCNVQLL